MPKKSAVDEDQSVTLGVECYSLPQSSGVVLDGDVLEGDAVALDFKGIGAESTHSTISSRKFYIGMIVVSDDGIIAVFATYLNVVNPRWNDEFLFVNAPLDKDDLVVIHEGTTHLDGVVDVSELAWSIASNKDGVRIVVGRSGKRFAKG